MSVHCWQDGPFNEVECCGSTCMLQDGHDGDHSWVSDKKIYVQFPGSTARNTTQLHEAIWAFKRARAKKRIAGHDGGGALSFAEAVVGTQIDVEGFTGREVRRA